MAKQMRVGVKAAWITAGAALVTTILIIVFSISKNDSKTSLVQTVSSQKTDSGSISNYNAARDINIQIPTQEKKDTQIVNNGFVNQGGSGNVYNQTINNKPPQRHVNEKEIRKIVDSIRNKEIVIKMLLHSGDSEAESFAREIQLKLKALGFNVSDSPVYLASGGYEVDPKERVRIFPPIVGGLYEFAIYIPLYKH